MNLTLFISCSKENNQVPEVTMLSPSNNDVFQFGDSIHILAKVLDDQKILSVIVQLRQLDHVPVKSQSIVVNSASFNLDMYMVLDDASLSGSYYVEVRAFDAESYSASFRFVDIGTTPADLKRIFLFEELPGYTRLHVLKDSALKFVNSRPNDFLNSGSSFKNELIYLISENDGVVSGLDTAMGEKWQTSFGVTPGKAFFLDAIQDGENMVVSTSDGRIMSFDVSGNKVVDYSVEGGHEARKICRHSVGILYDKYKISNAQSNLQLDYFPSGQPSSQLLFEFGEIRQLLSYNWQYVLIFSKLSGNNIVSRFNSENSGMLKLSEDTGEDFVSALLISADNVLVSRLNGVYSFNPNTWKFTLLNSIANVHHLKLSPDKSEVYALAGTKLLVLNPQSGNTIREVELGFEAQSFELDFE